MRSNSRPAAASLEPSSRSDSGSGWTASKAAIAASGRRARKTASRRPPTTSGIAQPEDDHGTEARHDDRERGAETTDGGEPLGEPVEAGAFGEQLRAMRVGLVERGQVGQPSTWSTASAETTPRRATSSCRRLARQAS